MANNVGDLMRLSAEFRDENDTLADPTTVELRYKKPNGQKYKINSGSITKDDTGKYHYDLSIDLSGTWYYLWKGAGAVQAVEQGSFPVEESEC